MYPLSCNQMYATVLHPSADSRRDVVKLQAKVCAQSTGELLSQACPGKSVAMWTDRLDMTIAVY